MYDELVKRLKNCATQAAPCETCGLIEDGSCSDTLMKQAADVRPVARGKWETDTCHVYCSICGEYEDNKSNFCPNCGADMREDEE